MLSNRKQFVLYTMCAAQKVCTETLHRKINENRPGNRAKGDGREDLLSAVSKIPRVSKEPKMEQGVNKVVSFGIGALESARASAETLLKNLETEINALIANGESVQSENVVKVRSAVTDASKRVSTILDQAKAQYTDLSAKAQKAYADLSAKASELAAKLPINKGQAA